MPAIPSRDLLGRIAEAYRGNTAMDVDNKYIILTNGATISDNSTMLDIISAEVAPGFGYARVAYSPSASSFDAGQSRQELPVADAEFIASGGSIQYDYGVILSGAGANASASVSNINTGATRLEFSSNPNFSNGDRVVITADAGGTVPTALDAALLYVVGAGSSGGTYWIQCASTEGGSALSVNGGSTPIRARHGNGKFDFYQSYGSTTLADGQSDTLKIRVNFGSGSTDVNAT